MKRLRQIGAAAAALVSVLPFAACAHTADLGAAKVELLMNDATRVVLSVTAGDRAHSLYDALALFAERGVIRMEGSHSEYGFFVTSVNGKDADESNYWAVYTTLTELDGVSYSDASFGTWEYEGRVLASASYGVSGLPLEEGELYALIWTQAA